MPGMTSLALSPEGRPLTLIIVPVPLRRRGSYLQLADEWSESMEVIPKTWIHQLYRVRYLQSRMELPGRDWRQCNRSLDSVVIFIAFSGHLVEERQTLIYNSFAQYVVHFIYFRRRDSDYYLFRTKNGFCHLTSYYSYSAHYSTI